jgi:hypothetical protein
MQNMILKFKFKPEYWDRAAMKGPNLFIKSMKFKDTYQNFGIGELKDYSSEQASTVTEEALKGFMKRKAVVILEEFNENLEDNDKDRGQEELPFTGDSKLPSLK